MPELTGVAEDPAGLPRQTRPPIDDAQLDRIASDRSSAGIGALLGALGPMVEEAWAYCVRGLMQRNAMGPAREILVTAQKRFPESLELLYLQGNLERLTGNGARARVIFGEVLLRDPHHEPATIGLAVIHRDRGQMVAASKILLELHRHHPHPRFTAYVAGFLGECGRSRDALAVCESAIASDGGSRTIVLQAAKHAITMGHFGRARMYLLQVLDSEDPDWSTAIPLSLCQRYESAAHPDLARFEKALGAPEPTESDKGAIGFALGKGLDDVGHFSAAAEAFTHANRRSRSPHAWRADRWDEFVSRQIETRPAACLDTPVQEDIVPVFVVGLPRTGTTLLAELLSGHPEIRSRGELNWISYLVQHLEMSSGEKLPKRMKASAELYLAHLRQDDEPARWYIDKNPLNFRHLGLIGALFPNAHILVCRRNRRDTALSIWTQHFQHPDNAYAYDFDDIAAFGKGHDRLIQHAQASSRVPIQLVDYEDLVEDAGREIDKVLHFLGASLDLKSPASAAAPDRSISTASAWQARQPVYRRSVGRWQRYAAHLPGFEERFPDEH